MHECTCGRMKWLRFVCHSLLRATNRNFPSFFLLLCCGFWIWWARNIVRFVTFFVDAVMAEMPFSWCYVTFVIRISAVWVHAIWILVIVESSWNAGAALSALSRCRVCLMRRPIENRSRTLTHQPTILYSWLFFFIHSCAIRQAKTTTSERAQRNIPTTHMYVCCVWRRCVLLFWIRTSSTTMVTLIYFCLYDAYYVQTSRIAASIFLLLTLLVRQHTKRSRARRQTMALQWRKKNKCGWCRNIA